MRFDSGPEVFVRVNRNYVLTEYVLNENDCTWCTTQPCRCRKSNLHCSAACSCTNCSNSTEEEEGSVVGNDTMSMDDDIDEQED